MGRQIDRRKLLRGIAGTGLFGLAGCVGGPGTGDGGDGQEDQQPGAGQPASPTPGGSPDGTPSGEETTEAQQQQGGGGPDVLNVIGYPESGLQLFRDYYSMRTGEEEEIIVPDGLLDPEMQKQVGNPMENVTGTAPGVGGPNQDAFTQLFRDEYGNSPGVFTAHTFDSVAILILANVAAGENSGPAIKEQMRRVANGPGQEYGPQNLVEAVNAAANGDDINYQGASSAVNFDERGDPADATYDVWKFAPDTDAGYEVLDSVTFEAEAGGPMADSAPGGTGRTVKVGLLLPETGDLASVGGPMIQAGRLAAKVAGDADVEIDVGFQDTQTNPQAGISAANSLVNAGYPAVCGSASSGVNVPVSEEVFIPNQIVGCSPSSTALTVSLLEDNDFIFRTAPSDFLQGQVMAQVSAQRLGGSTASTLFVNNDYGQQLSKQFSESFQSEQNGSILRQVSFEKQQSSYTSVLQNALQPQ